MRVHVRNSDDCDCGPDCDDIDGCVPSCRCENQDCIDITREGDQ